MTEYHLSRGWYGDPEWFMDCCPHEPCGYTNPKNWTKGCPNHNLLKTIRNTHKAEDCPGDKVISQ